VWKISERLVKGGEGDTDGLQLGWLGGLGANRTPQFQRAYPQMDFTIKTGVSNVLRKPGGGKPSSRHECRREKRIIQD